VLRQGVDWVTATVKGGAAQYANVDISRIAAAGQSCGATQAYQLAQDPRVTAIGIFNSGITNASEPLPTKITKPIFYFLGGPTDIAYKNVRAPPPSSLPFPLSALFAGDREQPQHWVLKLSG